MNKLSMVVQRSEWGNYWIAPNRNGRTDYVWPRDCSGLLAEAVKQFGTRREAEDGAREVGFVHVTGQVRQLRTRLSEFWVVVGSEGAILADEAAVGRLQMDKLREVWVEDMRVHRDFGINGRNGNIGATRGGAPLVIVCRNGKRARLVEKPFWDEINQGMQVHYENDQVRFSLFWPEMTYYRGGEVHALDIGPADIQG